LEASYGANYRIECEFKQGKRHGVRRIVDTRSNVISAESTYVNDTLVSCKEYLNDGKDLASEILLQEDGSYYKTLFQVTKQDGAGT
jgi:hypothetical protein